MLLKLALNTFARISSFFPQALKTQPTNLNKIPVSSTLNLLPQNLTFVPVHHSPLHIHRIERPVHEFSSTNEIDEHPSERKMALTYGEQELQAAIAMMEERVEEAAKRGVKLSHEEAFVPVYRRLVPWE